MVIRAAVIASSPLSMSESAVRSTTVGTFLCSQCLLVAIAGEDARQGKEVSNGLQASNMQQEHAQLTSMPCRAKWWNDASMRMAVVFVAYLKVVGATRVTGLHCGAALARYAFHGLLKELFHLHHHI